MKIMKHYRVYMEFMQEHDTEAPTAQAAVENFKAMLQLYTVDELIEMGSFGVDDLTNNERTEVTNW
jgi:hypothetical protein